MSTSPPGHDGVPPSRPADVSASVASASSSTTAAASTSAHHATVASSTAPSAVAHASASLPAASSSASPAFHAGVCPHTRRLRPALPPQRHLQRRLRLITRPPWTQTMPPGPLLPWWSLRMNPPTSSVRSTDLPICRSTKTIFHVFVAHLSPPILPKGGMIMGPSALPRRRVGDYRSPSESSRPCHRSTF